MTYLQRCGIGAAFISGVILSTGIAFADHAWGSNHWARTSNPFTLTLGDSVSAAWDPYLRVAAADWNVSSVLDVSVVKGMNASNPKNCRPITGRGEVCNAKYGANGWLGIAQIYVTGGHISAGIVKLNDTYFSMSAYNKPEWRSLVMCQEVGHIFGLAHQDESMTNANLGTCMDYTNAPASNQHPNQHDYDMLESMYAHLDTTSTLAPAVKMSAPAVVSEDPRDWGEEMRRSNDGRASLYVRSEGDAKVITHVMWVEDAQDNRTIREKDHSH